MIILISEIRVYLHIILELSEGLGAFPLRQEIVGFKWVGAIVIFFITGESLGYAEVAAFSWTQNQVL